MNFEFEARNEQGQTINGSLVAEDTTKAERILWQNKLTVISLKPKKDFTDVFGSIFNRVSAKDILLFCKQLATLLDSGFPILQSLSIIILQTSSKKFKEVLSQISADLEEGHSFSTAIAKHPDVFSTIFISAVKAGEASGKLPDILKQLSDNLEQEYNFISKIKGALTYPIFVICAMIVIATIMLVKVVPQLASLFKESNVALPWTTRAVIWTSVFIQNYWWAIILFIIIVVVAIRYWGRTTSGRYQIDLLKLRFPVSGKLVTLSYMARFCRTMSLLSATGIPILKSIKIVSEAMTNEIYQEGLDEVYQEVERGVPMSVPLSKNKFFAPMVSNMIGVGEKSGNLDDILKSLTKYYEAETESAMKQLSSLLEPILIVIIGIGVAILVLSIIMPIYNLAQVI
jgi:type IV pilus assembly protein PilC